MGDKKSKEIGIRAFVMKPILMGEIAKTIREVLDRNQAVGQKKLL